MGIFMIPLQRSITRITCGNVMYDLRQNEWVRKHHSSLFPNGRWGIPGPENLIACPKLHTKLQSTRARMWGQWVLVLALKPGLTKACGFLATTVEHHYSAAMFGSTALGTCGLWPCWLAPKNASLWCHVTLSHTTSALLAPYRELKSWMVGPTRSPRESTPAYSGAPLSLPEPPPPIYPWIWLHLEPIICLYSSSLVPILVYSPRTCSCSHF